MVSSQSDSLILDIKVHNKIIKSPSIENLQLRSVMHYSKVFFKGLQFFFAKILNWSPHGKIQTCKIMRIVTWELRDY